MKILIRTPEIKYASLKGTHPKGWLIHQISNGLNHMSMALCTSSRALIPFCDDCMVVDLGENKFAHRPLLDGRADFHFLAMARRFVI